MVPIHKQIKAFQNLEQDLASAIARDAPMVDIRALDNALSDLARCIADHAPVDTSEWRAKFSFFISLARNGDISACDRLELMVAELISQLSGDPQIVPGSH